MIISILGTGIVGRTIAAKMSALGHRVKLGTRSVKDTIDRPSKGMDGLTFKEWSKQNPSLTLLNYEDLPAETNLFVNATNGGASLDALKKVGKGKLKGKTIIDIGNPLDFSKGMPPSLFICNTDSLGEAIQREFPESNVVKSLNTMNCLIMMNPSLVPGDHSVFISGDNPTAKKEVEELLQAIGWKKSNIIDLGDLSTARGTEMLLPVWIRLWGAFGNANFNFHIAR
jgi:hypothetical protein